MHDSNPEPGGDPTTSLGRFGAPAGIAMIVVALALGVVAMRPSLGGGAVVIDPTSSTTVVVITTTVPTAPPSTDPVTTDVAPETVPDAVPDTVVEGVAESPTYAPVAGPHCTFTKGVTETCQSNDPSVDLRVVFGGDAQQCAFESTIDWGDGTSERVAVPGGESGARRVGSHTYHRSGRFALRQHVTLVAGTCRSYDGSYTFDLVD